MAEVNKIIETFNSTIKEFVDDICVVCPNSVISHNRSDVLTVLKIKKTFIIDGFVKYVLQYKDLIDKGDETFFLQKEYDEVEQEDQVFVRQIKSIWGQLNKQNKEIVAEYMKELCETALYYFTLIDNSKSK